MLAAIGTAVTQNGTVAVIALPQAIYFFRPDGEKEHEVLRDDVPEVTTALAFADDDRTLISASLQGRISEWRVPEA